MYTLPKGKTDNIFQLAKGVNSKVKILNLHGSLNWYTLTRSPNLIPSTMTHSSRIKCTRNIAIHPEMTFSGIKHLGRTKWYTWPVIVPPVFEKGPFITERLSPIWNNAFEEIGAADQIIVFGYSFPQADQQGRSFFKRAIASNLGLKRIIVINPDINAAVVANDIFSPQILVSTNDVISYINEYV
jgi:hypothetical protein